MKRVLSILLLSAMPAFAAESAKEPPKPPACGKTAEDCQKAVDALTKQIAELRAAVQGATQQRDNALKAQANIDLALSAATAQRDNSMKAQANAELQTFIEQHSAAK
jgi:hypothetical protein